MKNSWKIILEKTLAFDLIKKIYDSSNNTKILPAEKDVFSCFDFFEFEDTKVVILGQDPYFNDNQANGLAFSVPQTQALPPSLKNIFKELKNDLGITKTNGDLTDWAKQGILLLNTILTVEKGKPFSHHNYGWEKVTNFIIEEIAIKLPNVIFVLLGNAAKSKIKLLKKTNNIIQSSHPSPLGCHHGFIGSKIFSRINLILDKQNKEPIKW